MNVWLLYHRWDSYDSADLESIHATKELAEAAADKSCPEWFVKEETVQTSTD